MPDAPALLPTARQLEADGHATPFRALHRTLPACPGLARRSTGCRSTAPPPSEGPRSRPRRSPQPTCRQIGQDAGLRFERLGGRLDGPLGAVPPLRQRPRARPPPAALAVLASVPTSRTTAVAPTTLLSKPSARKNSNLTRVISASAELGRISARLPPASPEETPASHLYQPVSQRTAGGHVRARHEHSPAAVQPCLSSPGAQLRHRPHPGSSVWRAARLSPSQPARSSHRPWRVTSPIVPTRSSPIQAEHGAPRTSESPATRARLRH